MLRITTTRHLHDLEAAAVKALTDRDMALAGEALALARAARAQRLTDGLWRRLHEQYRDLTAHIVQLTAERDAARAAAKASASAAPAVETENFTNTPGGTRWTESPSSSPPT
ncbi:hypothetical protein [Streptomyces cinereoruber]|uniref:hypothetical protein n=1 Tax=Streptomyces cinereoruber TaxID=67260 RepID=UPI003630FE1A